MFEEIFHFFSLFISIAKLIKSLVQNEFFERFAFLISLLKSFFITIIVRIVFWSNLQVLIF